jgi:NAD(P)-dependent dehydrogenase (short-subunit alcohol dehydrogenase family)
MKNRIKKSDEIIRDDCLEVLKKIPFEKFKNKRVLVTGGTGLLGRYIVRTIGWANSIQRNNCKILAVGRHISKSDRDFGKKYGVTYVQKDISKPFSMPGRFDFIFHAAGYAQPAKFIANPLATIRINIDATANLLELAKKSNGVFVFFSSAEYEMIGKIIDEMAEHEANAPAIPKPGGGSSATGGGSGGVIAGAWENLFAVSSSIKSATAAMSSIMTAMAAPSILGQMTNFAKGVKSEIKGGDAAFESGTWTSAGYKFLTTVGLMEKRTSTKEAEYTSAIQQQIAMTKQWIDLIRSKHAEKIASKQGILSMRQDGVVKILNGITSLEEVQSVVDLNEE